MVFKIGLTGGIGCGKSTVADLFQSLGVPIIDTDIIARELVAPGQSALAQICTQWGADICHADGSLNRGKLRDIIFQDEQQKRLLEQILHPLIYQAMQAKALQLQAPYCLIAIPLLFETHAQSQVDRILVVDCPIEVQMARVKARDQLTDAQIAAIISTQVSREHRRSHADDVLDNTYTSGDLAEQVKNLHNLYLSLSHT